jgi:hypothetical protein
LNPKIVKRVYKYFEKNYDEVIIKLMETFVGCLRYQERACNVDVELYMRKTESLQVAMNRFDPYLVKGHHARSYYNAVKDIKEHFTTNPAYADFVPFLVYLSKVCTIVFYCIEEKKL